MVLRTLAFLAASLVLLAACSDDDPEPILAPSSSAEPTSAEPSATQSSKPETAEQFIERWVELSNDMQVSGDSDDYLAVSSACRPCVAVANDVEAIYAAGGSVETRGWEVLRFEKSTESPSRVQIDARIMSHPVALARSSGAALERLPGGPLGVRFGLSLKDGQWSVADLAEVPS